MGAHEEEWSGEEKDRKSATDYYAKLSGICAALVWGVGMKATVFFIRSRKSVCISRVSRGKLSKTNSGGLQHPSEISNNDWIGQPELYQTMPKPNYAQEDQKH